MSAVDVLVYGASGRIGRLLAGSWASAPVITCARTPAPWVDGVAALDPQDDALTRALQGCGAMILLAGATAKADQHPDGHADLAISAAQCCRAAGVSHLVLMSSAAIYGRATQAGSEDMAPAPINAYGTAKARLEQVAPKLAGADLAITVLRLGNVAGADALLGGAQRQPVHLDRFQDGTTPRRSYIGPKTLAAALLEIARRPPETYRVLNLAQPGPVAMSELLDAAGIERRARAAPSTALPRLELDLDRASALIGLPRATPDDLVAQWRDAESYHDAG